MSSCSSASVHSLPCGPRIAKEKESGFSAPSRFKSAGAGEYTGGAVVGAEAQDGNPAGLELGAGGVEFALARSQTMGRPYLDDTA
jgi:hypothetical protein